MEGACLIPPLGKVLFYQVQPGLELMLIVNNCFVSAIFDLEKDWRTKIIQDITNGVTIHPMKDKCFDSIG